MPQLDFKRPNRCGDSGPTCVEVAIDVSGRRIIRNSARPETQVIFDEAEWVAFLDSIRAGQTY
ncbi:DUF397 domain-containing protein [Micromonospora sp. WMMD723]|uniref:DUF397 domain-containing protein n=1 Tax=Micromonospora sp. WMMD723 TaxID=3403465 RepID=UPI003CE76AFD